MAKNSADLDIMVNIVLNCRAKVLRGYNVFQQGISSALLMSMPGILNTGGVLLSTH